MLEKKIITVLLFPKGQGIPFNFYEMDTHDNSIQNADVDTAVGLGVPVNMSRPCARAYDDLELAFETLAMKLGSKVKEEIASLEEDLARKDLLKCFNELGNAFRRKAAQPVHAVADEWIRVTGEEALKLLQLELEVAQCTFSSRRGQGAERVFEAKGIGIQLMKLRDHVDKVFHDPALAGSGEDHTRQAVPLPSRSTACTAATLSTLGKGIVCAAAQPLPDWLQ